MNVLFYVSLNCTHKTYPKLTLKCHIVFLALRYPNMKNLSTLCYLVFGALPSSVKSCFYDQNSPPFIEKPFQRPFFTPSIPNPQNSPNFHHLIFFSYLLQLILNLNLQILTLPSLFFHRVNDRSEYKPNIGP